MLIDQAATIYCWKVYIFKRSGKSLKSRTGEQKTHRKLNFPRIQQLLTTQETCSQMWNKLHQFMFCLGISLEWREEQKKTGKNHFMWDQGSLTNLWICIIYVCVCILNICVKICNQYSYLPKQEITRNPMLNRRPWSRCCNKGRVKHLLVLKSAGLVSYWASGNSANSNISFELFLSRVTSTCSNHPPFLLPAKLAVG